MKYKAGDYVGTKKGYMLIQCSFEFKQNNNPKTDKLGGRTLYWLQDDNFDDVILWDTELKALLIEEELITLNYNPDGDEL